MYRSLTSDEMGFRQSMAFRHANENWYVRGRKRSDKRITAGPVTRRNADGTVKVEQGPVTPTISRKVTRLTAKQRQEFRNPMVQRILALQAELYNTPR